MTIRIVITNIILTTYYHILVKVLMKKPLTMS